MPPSPDAAARSADAATILVVSDQRDWHARQMEAAFAAVGARAARIDLAACDFDTRSPSGLALPFLGRRLPDAVHVRTMSAGSFEAITKRLGVLHALAELGVARLERRARHRTLCRQVDDELPARSRRRADAADLDDGIGGNRARPRRARSAARPAGAQTAVRRAGQGLAPHSPAGRLAGAGRRRRRLLSPALSTDWERGLQGLSTVRPARPRGRRHDAQRLDLDHQPQAGRPTLGRRA